MRGHAGILAVLARVRHQAGGALAKPRATLERIEAQLRFRCLRRERRQRQGVRVGCAQVGGQVDDADQLTGERVVDRRGRAGPRVNGRHQVLGREDLDGVIERHRRADRVGPDRRLRPRGALDEAHPVRQLDRAPLATHPQQVRLRVRDRDHVTDVAVEAREGVEDRVDRTCQRRTLLTLAELVVAQHDHRAAGIRRHAGGQAAPPAGEDQITHPPLGCHPGTDATFVRATERSSVLDRVREGIERDPRIAQFRCSPSGTTPNSSFCLPPEDDPSS